MSAGLPLLVLSLLSCIVTFVWMFYGAGVKQARIIVGVIFLLLLISCWVVLLNKSVFGEYGASAMGIGFVVSLLMLFVPVIHRKLINSDDT